MKTYNRLLALIVIAFTTLFISCEKNDSDVDQNIITPQQYEFVGIEHNQALDHVYNGISQYLLTKTDKTMTIDELYALVASHTNAYLQKSPTTSPNLTEMLGISSDEFDASKSFYKFKSLTIKDNSSLLTSRLNSYNLTKTQISIINDLFSRMDLAENMNDIYAIVDDINSEAAEKISDPKELAAVYSATSVAKYSSSYWLTFLNDWEDMFDMNTYKEDSRSDWNWRSTAKADVTGAVGGAVGGAMAGSLAGGVGALPGAATGALIGGASSSAADAAGQLFDRIFK